MRRQTVSRKHEKIKEIGESIQYFSPDKLEERNRVQSQPEGQFVLPVLLFRIETGTQFFVSAFVLESLKLVTSVIMWCCEGCPRGCEIGLQM